MLKNIKILSLGWLIAFNIISGCDSDAEKKLSDLLRLIAVDEIGCYYYKPPFGRNWDIINYSCKYDVNKMFGPAKDETLLRAAVVFRAEWAVQTLIEVGADPSLENSARETVLQCANRLYSRPGDTEKNIIRLLKEANAKRDKTLHWRKKGLEVSSSVAKVSIE